MAGITDKGVQAMIAEALRQRKALFRTDGIVPGLTFTATKVGRGSWYLRYRYGGKCKEITIGQYPAWGIQEARKKARELRRAVDQGFDVAYEKQSKKVDAKILGRSQALNRAMLCQVVDWLSTWWESASDNNRSELFKQWQQAVVSLPGASKWPE